MSVGHTGPERHAARIFRDNWLWFVIVGGVLILGGIGAILVPALSDIAPNEVLGYILIGSGLVQVVQSTKMAQSAMFVWHLVLGILATIGGALIYMDTFAGVITLTLLIAIIFAIHGTAQVGFSLKVAGQSGWHWFLTSGCIALIAAVLLVVKLPYTHSFTPATVAGASLLFSGWAYVAMALASRRTDAA